MAEEKKRSWIVRLRATVIKEVVTSECSREEAESNPYDHCKEETECDGEGYEVIDVRPNE